MKAYVDAGAAVLAKNGVRLDARAYESADWVPQGNLFVRERFDPNFQVVRYEDELHALPEYGDALAAVRADGLIRDFLANRIAAAPITFAVDERALIDGLLYAVARATAEGRAASDAFDQIYQATEESAFATTSRYVVIAPLPGLDALDPLPLDLEPNVAVERLTDAEIVLCIQAGFLRSAGSWSVVDVGERIGLRIVREIDRPALNDDDAIVAAAQACWADSGESFERFVTALRLATPARVATPGYVTYSDSWFGRGSFQWAPGDTPVAAHQPATSMSTTECEALRGFWGDLELPAVERNNALQAALRRVRFAFGRARPDDRLVDFMIAAETFFLPKSREGELRFKLALRAAFYIEDVGSGKQERFRTMQRAYDVRSEIVHGVPPEELKRIPEGLTLEPFADEVGTYIRSALGKATHHLAGGGTLPDWDALVLGAS